MADGLRLNPPRVLHKFTEIMRCIYREGLVETGKHVHGRRSHSPLRVFSRKVEFKGVFQSGMGPSHKVGVSNIQHAHARPTTCVKYCRPTQRLGAGHDSDDISQKT
jgi:hypothetical protein